MNILITGGAGYIGSIVANYFLDKKYNVTIIDNLSKGYKFLIPKAAFFINSDIANKNKITKLLKEKKFQVLIHLAGLTDVEESMIKSKKYIDNNFKKSKIFFEICQKFKLNKIIFSSTAAVYANSKKGIVSEYSRIKPLSPYGKSKQLFENYLRKKKNIKYIILRYFNVAGSDIKNRSGPVHQKTLFKKLSKAILKKKVNFKLYGNNYNTIDGSTVRDFIHVEDLARIHLIAANHLMKKKSSLILNCGYGRGISVLNVVKSAKKLFRKNIKIIIHDRRKGDLAKVVAEANKIKKIFKWKPKFNNLKRMLKDSVNWELKLYKK